jgi:tripartite-type tricarboxylate transporter receptor subunit TctC
MSSHVLAPAMSKNAGFDPIRDFTHIAYFGGAPSVILVHPSLGVKTFNELLSYARAQAGGVEYVSSGAGTVGNVIVEFIALKEQLKVAHVPYRSGSGAIVDLLAGRVKVGALNWSTAREHVAAGTLIPVGVSSSKRLAALPELPTLNELGHPDMITTTWHALSGPAGLPKDIVERTNGAVSKILERPDIRKQLENDAIETQAMTPAELTDYFRNEVAKWTPVVRATVKAE